MNLKIIPLILIALHSQSKSDDLLNERDWTSVDGVIVKAKLEMKAGDLVTLKRASNGKKFDVNISKLSIPDSILLEDTSEKLDKMATDSLSRDKNYLRLSDISEKNWELAYRFGKSKIFWDAIISHKWIGLNSNEIVNITPKKIIRQGDGHYLIIGENVAIRLLANRSANLRINADRLILSRGGYNDFDYCVKGIKNLIRVRDVNDLVSCKPETIGTQEYLVFEIMIHWQTPD